MKKTRFTETKIVSIIKKHETGIKIPNCWVGVEEHGGMEAWGHGELKIYPNPAKNYLAVEYVLDEIPQNAFLAFYSSDGRMVHKQRLEPSGSHTYINTKDWPGGLYFYFCYDQSNSIADGKIIIIK